ncbi:MAG: FUSC family protein, partial [Candidatus Promineifilaceae bacterium]
MSNTLSLGSALKRSAPIRVSDRTRVALQTGVAMVLAYGVALAMDWHKPYWAGLAVALCALGSVGESLHKGMQRVLGTLVALVLSFVVLSLFIQDRWLFLLAGSLWTVFCSYLSMTSARSYFWIVAGFSLPLLTIGGGG